MRETIRPGKLSIPSPSVQSLLKEIMVDTTPWDGDNPLNPLAGGGGGGRGRLRARKRRKAQFKENADSLRNPDWIWNGPKNNLQHTFKHAEHFGIKGPMNKQNLKELQKALEKHIKSPDTKIIAGEYQRQPAIHYYNDVTKLNVIRRPTGELWSGWRLSPEKQFHMKKDGRI